MVPPDAAFYGGGPADRRHTHRQRPPRNGSSPDGADPAGGGHFCLEAEGQSEMDTRKDRKSKTEPWSKQRQPKLARDHAFPASKNGSHSIFREPIRWPWARARRSR